MKARRGIPSDLFYRKAISKALLNNIMYTCIGLDIMGDIISSACFNNFSKRIPKKWCLVQCQWSGQCKMVSIINILQ